MIVIEIALLVLSFATCVYGTVSDIKFGKIKNKVLLVIFFVGICLDIVYYAFFVRDIALDFVINTALVFALSIALYVFHIWAGGDLKFVVALSILFPARYYIAFNSFIYTLYYVIALAFVLGYFYLLIQAIIGFIQLKYTLKPQSFVKSLKNCVKSYFLSMIYIVLFSCIYNIFLTKHFALPEIIIAIFFIVVGCLAIYIKTLHNKIVVVSLLVIDTVLCIVFRFLPLGTNYYVYIITLLIIVLKIVISNTLYEFVPLEKLKKGMILAIPSNIACTQLGVCFDSKSSEDLSGRLNENEVADIKLKCSGKDIKLYIVKKVPFVFIISIAYLVYMVLGVALKCI